MKVFENEVVFVSFQKIIIIIIIIFGSFTPRVI
jgi:hypothetical protein